VVRQRGARGPPDRLDLNPTRLRRRPCPLDPLSLIELYEILTLHPAFEDQGVQTIMKIRKGEFVPVAERNPRRLVPESLADLCTRAMATDPVDRPETGEAFEEELRAWLDGRSEAERRHRQAESLAAQGKEAAKWFWAMKETLAEAEQTVEIVAKDFKPWRRTRDHSWCSRGSVKAMWNRGRSASRRCSRAESAPSAGIGRCPESSCGPPSGRIGPGRRVEMDRDALLRVVEDAVLSAEELSKRYLKASVALSVLESDCALQLRLGAREAAREYEQADESLSGQVDYSKVVQRLEGLSLEPFYEFARAGKEVATLLERLEQKRRVAVEQLSENSCHRSA
jgi:hypothetical protein